jgi:hypothetical protein
MYPEGAREMIIENVRARKDECQKILSGRNKAIIACVLGGALVLGAIGLGVYLYQRSQKKEEE